MSINNVLFVLILLLALGFSFWTVIRVFKKREGAFRIALEANQKRLDYQSSRISILTRALPSLQALILKTTSSEDWKVLCLDEARALLRADGASYWRYIEKNQKCELDSARGCETIFLDKNANLGLTTELFADVTKKRIPALTLPDNNPDGFKSMLFIPLLVSGDLWGVYRFVRKTEERLTQRDCDLVTMFINQLALAVENRDMITNHEKFYLELIQSLADTLDSRDASTEGQTRRARSLARGIAKAMDLPDEFIYYLEFAALLHDIGNIGIDEQLLKKPGKLTAQEFEQIKKHPIIGHKILAPVSMLAPVAPMVLYHQEWFNGKGYPEGLVGEEIPLGARIVAVLDAWSAMTSPRAWRKALTKDEALKEIRKGSGTQFDPKVVEAFLSTVVNQKVSI